MLFCFGESEPIPEYQYHELEAFALKLCRQILDQYGFPDWNVVIDRRPKSSRMGMCRYYVKEIGLSHWYLKSLCDSPRPHDEIEYLICHEVAHVLAPRLSHRLLWKQQFARLLWNARKGNEGDVRFALDECQYCRRHSDRLVQYAQSHQKEPVKIVLPPVKKTRKKESYPPATRQVHIVENHHVRSLWILGEGPKVFMCSILNDRCGEGKRTRISKAEYEGLLFFNLVDARRRLIESLETEIDRWRSRRYINDEVRQWGMEAVEACIKRRDEIQTLLGESMDDMNELLNLDES